jgi:fatty-acyl-CoA synthase
MSAGAHDPGRLLVWSDAELVEAFESSLELRGARVLPVAPLAHSVGLFTTLRTLLARGTAVLTELEPFDPSHVWDAVRRDDVEVLSIASRASLQALADALAARRRRPTPDRLRAIVCATPIDAATRSIFSECLPGVALRAPSDAPRIVGERLRVVDLDTGHDVVRGSSAVGNVLVAGVVPLGYLGDPQRTATELCSIGGVRYVITGERATVDDQGVVHSARRDTQDQGAGGRTRLRDVEARLRKHPSVSECVVVTVTITERGVAAEHVVALVQVRERHYLDEAELVAWCRSRLGAIEPPERFLFVGDLALPGDADDEEAVRRRAAALLQPRP